MNLKKRNISGTAYAGGVISYYGNMIIDLSTTRSERRIPLLWCHDTDDDIFGVIESKLEGNSILIDGFVYDDETTATIIQKLDDNAPYGLSVGIYDPKYRDAIEGETINGVSLSAGTTIASGGILREVSLCALAIDENTSVILASADKAKNIIRLSCPVDAVDGFGVTLSAKVDDEPAEQVGQAEQADQAEQEHQEESDVNPDDSVTVESDFAKKINELISENESLKQKVELSAKTEFLATCGRELTQPQREFAMAITLSMAKQYIATLPADRNKIPAKQNISLSAQKTVELELPPGVVFSD